MNKTELLKHEMRLELEGNILPWWRDRMTDYEHGGFYGRIDGHEQVHADAEKGAILNARTLWAFACAYRVTRNAIWLDTATRAKDYVLAHFIDPEQGGVFWSLNADGTPLDTKKQTYAIGFTIYGLSEYARATGDVEALEAALRLFRDVETHAYDAENNGYIEALTRDWQPIGDMRLSDKDENASRTMNTHLHIIEPYTNLLRCLDERITKGEDTYIVERGQVKAATERLLGIFTGIILNPDTYHLDLFFNDQWQGRRNIESYGHDIEAAWLLHETALVLGDEDALAQVEPLVKRIAQASNDGLQADGSMVYERFKDTGHTDMQRQWWVMCETVIGNVDLYQHFGDGEALGRALRCWDYVKENLIDRDHGEWIWAVRPDGMPDHEGDKAGFWKCPYHNSRMCLELIERQF